IHSAILHFSTCVGPYLASFNLQSRHRVSNLKNPNHLNFSLFFFGFPLTDFTFGYSIYSQTTARTSPAPVAYALAPRRPPQKPARDLCSSNPFIFMRFRTLCPHWRFATSFPSTTSALFPMQRRGECPLFFSALYQLLLSAFYLASPVTNHPPPTTN